MIFFFFTYLLSFNVDRLFSRSWISELTLSPVSDIFNLFWKAFNSSASSELSVCLSKYAISMSITSNTVCLTDVQTLFLHWVNRRSFDWAKCKGLRPCASQLFTSVPEKAKGETYDTTTKTSRRRSCTLPPFKSNVTTSMWCVQAAKCNGLFPNESLMFGLAPYARSNL